MGTTTVVGRWRAKEDPIVDSRDSILTVSEDVELKSPEHRVGKARVLESPKKSGPEKQIQAVRKEPRGWIIGLSQATFPFLENSHTGLSLMGQLESSLPLAQGWRNWQLSFLSPPHHPLNKV